MSIQAINSGSTQGYQVRVGPRLGGLTKFFAVRKYGGAKKALAQAREAERSLQKLVPPSRSRSGARLTVSANNSSGVVGVRPRYSMFSDIPYLYFVSSWSIDGKSHCTGYSAEKHGLIGALTMAMEKRAKATGVPYEITPRQALNRMKHLITGA